jgi:3-oxoacyl-[acyl-carrier protein] reductase
MGWFEERGGLAGTVAVITGGAGGLGEAISSDLAANGVRLAVIDIDAAAAGRLRGSLAGAGHDAIVQHGDARDPDSLSALFAAVDERWGRLDTLVNVVGGTFRAAFLASGLSAFVTGTTLHPDGGTFASSDWFNWPDWGWANHAPPRFLPAISLARLIVAI